jgi:cytoskeleton protein RodZ
MESFGQKLKEARERKNYSLEQISEETHISRRYIIALEEEDFSAFPAETYFVGFLRNYAEYLGLNADELVALYKNIKMQEQPIPMDELIHGKKRIPRFFVMTLVVFFFIAFGIGFFIMVNGALQGSDTGATDETDVEISGDVYTLKGDSLTQRFKEGDILIISLQNINYEIIVSKIGDALSLVLPNGTVSLEFKDVVAFDLNSDDTLDVEIALNDIITLGDEKIVNLTILKGSYITQSSFELAEEYTEELVNQSEEEFLISNQDTESEIILTEDVQKPFKIEMDFIGNCLVRYVKDAKENRKERFYQKSEILTIDNINNYIMLWLSNAGMVNLVLNDKSIELGKRGQVTVKLIQWVQDTQTGMYQLKMVSAN